jgi:hypothetical protein
MDPPSKRTFRAWTMRSFRARTGVMITRRRSYPGIDVAGNSAAAILAAMGPYRAIADKALARHSIWKIEPDRPIPFDAFLGVFDTILETAGANTIFVIGKKIPEFAAWPPGVDDIFKALESIDVGYHMNHVKDGKMMFDPSTGQMTDEIGHYHFRLEAPRRIVMLCDNPYPSDLDRGLITALARKFEGGAEVELDPSKPTRLNGGDSCTFIVSF